MNCSCVSTSLVDTMAANSTAVEGTCQSTCILMIPAILLLLVLIIIAFFIAIPYQHFIIRYLVQ